jgi:hypothetical protein
MKIGFTGTRQGMSPSQAKQLRWILAILRHADQMITQQTIFIDGDCETGADREARKMAELSGCEADPVPPANNTSAALLARDRVIANACHILIAAPLTDKEELRSGTWATVRYARQAGKPVVMLSRGA